MEGPTLGRRKRGRVAPLRCHVVDDHCDALRHIHAAIRKGALPFTGLRMMHWDAHPDLMVTPDMPAATCFCPHDLYHTLEAAEGGIAEWILPLVYQVGQADANVFDVPCKPQRYDQTIEPSSSSPSALHQFHCRLESSTADCNAGKHHLARPRMCCFVKRGATAVRGNAHIVPSSRACVKSAFSAPGTALCMCVKCAI